MNKGLLFSLLLLCVLSSTFLLHKRTSQAPAFDPILETKHYPSDQFFLQRSFPDAAIDLVSYTKALKIAKEAAISRSPTNNFNKPWTVQGPGNMGARVNTIAVHPENEQIIFAGYSGGGIFRTMDGGQNWIPIFDDQLFLAIGDIVFDTQDPNTLYVGTGDPNISGFPFLGDGVYKSTNLGGTWEYIGLEDQRIISKIIIHPTNNQIIYVAAMGLPFEPNPDKGLYKTIDGGKTWEQVLFLGGITGVIDVVFDRNDPNTLFAAGWDRLRNNKVSETTGPGAKIYRSTNGGAQWQQLAGGLPLEDQSRIGLASTSDGIIAVYVDETHNFQGLYKTTNGGITWFPIPTDAEKNDFNPSVFASFGWYFAKIRVNPQNDNDITILGVRGLRTVDGGQSWTNIHEKSLIGVHTDVHDLVFSQSGKLIMGTDGGMYRFDLAGENWEDIENIPTTQVYRIAYNPHKPQNYYAGTQDNGTSGGNANTINSWDKIYGGDGFQMVFHPTESTIYYAESQRGNIGVTLDEGQTWENATEGIDPSDRKNWDMPYFLSPHDPNVLFTGTYRIYRSTVGAIPDWKAISPDLTNGETDDLRQTISTIDQSPIDPNILYAGTTDANLWRTLNNGDSWERLNGLPQRYFTEVIASPDFEETVYASVSGYKDNDNTAHIFRSDDQGNTWSAIAGNLPPLAINCMKVIPNYEDQIIFVGTDGGVYGTINGGASWERVGEDFPIVAVYDIDWNPNENTLIAGTFARSVLSYPLDGIVEGDNLSSVNFKQQAENVLKLFPNPVQNDLTIEFNNLKPNKAVLVSIFSATGQLMKQVKRQSERAVSWRVDTSDLPSGTYLLKIQGEYFSFLEKFVKI